MPRSRSPVFREFIMSQGWTPWGAFARKMIRGNEYPVGNQDSGL